jgi:pimeloyl-ACP methyl ester carboxylesterase
MPVPKTGALPLGDALLTTAVLSSVDLTDFTLITLVGQATLAYTYLRIMSKNASQKLIDDTSKHYIQPLNMNGMQGRMLKAPATKRTAKREMLVLYGHHALLERWWGLIENLQEFGPVTMPDLPGFGGMDSFATLKRQPTIDEYADYLAAFIKMTYKRRRFTVVAISFGFVIATRMLQKYPEIATKVDLVVSMVGFMHYDDFQFKPLKRKTFVRATRFIARRPVAWLIRYGALNKFVIRNIYARLGAGKRRFIEMEPTQFDTLMDFEVRLWQSNDVRTHWLTTSEFLQLDNCQKPIDLPVWHVYSSGDQYFRNDYVEQHMQVVFSSYDKDEMKSASHTPSVLGDKKELGVMLPPKLRKVLRKKP